MAIDKEIARLSKLLVDSEGISFPEAEARLRGLTLQVIIGKNSKSPAAHAAALTIVAVGRRTFLGGVRVAGEIDQPVITAFPVEGRTLGEACHAIGATDFAGEPSFTIVVGESTAVGGDLSQSVAIHWNNWVVGVRPIDHQGAGEDGNNPLAGIAAGGLAVGYAFDTVRGLGSDLPADIDLWGLPEAPAFAEVFLPGAIWIVGLGNLGQAFVWALSSLPYSDPSDVSLILHDFDHISDENWGTSVLVADGESGTLKTKLVEQWINRRGFVARRVDRRLLATDRIDEGEPRLSFSGLDKNAARRAMASVGFEAIVDAGLGRTAENFDRLRVTVLHGPRTADTYFAGMSDPLAPEPAVVQKYQELADVDRCGAAEIAGASVAVPYVSAIAATTALARMIALVSNQPFIPSVCRRTSATQVRSPAAAQHVDCPGLLHAGRPAAAAYHRRFT
jgi:hypothetical protein